MFKRLSDVERGRPIVIYINGERVDAYLGETLASAILTAGFDGMRTTILSGSPRGYYCGIGICCECIVELEDGSRVKACQTQVENGMKVKIPRQPGQEE
jgi:D-hydroxyproline dehydrogenase subunit gamma